MAASQEVLLTQIAWVQTDSGRQLVRHGEPLPEDVLSDEVDYLRGLGALGTPSAPAKSGETADEVDALSAALTDEAVTDYVRDTPVKEIIAAVGDDAEQAQRVLTAESDATGGEPRKSLVSALEKVIEASAPAKSGE